MHLIANKIWWELYLCILMILKAKYIWKFIKKFYKDYENIKKSLYL